MAARQGKTMTDEHARQKACGYVYNDGNRDVASFSETFGFNPILLPRYFNIAKNGIVTTTPRFRNECKAGFSNVRHHFDMLTGRIE
jgi:hypothetical protein